MDFFQLLGSNFWLTVVLLLFVISIVSIVLGIALEAYKVNSKSRQKLMELRNEELRLQIQLDQQRKGPLSAPTSGNLYNPKEASWAEQSQSNYEMGYQQQQQG
jgi:type II secretory pathway pseudopilin PulG